jgi:tRNA C32,U32 (ribose-2'-O)-methylase TrmJ
MAMKAAGMPERISRRQIRPGVGRAPAVALVDPKYGHNVAGALRACSAFGVGQLWVTGERAISEWSAHGRLPREERMKAYGEVDVCLGDYFFDAFTADVTPVAVEVREQAEPLTTFQHPERALYVFGPEDGGLHKTTLQRCHRFVIIPSDHCLNLAAAVNAVLLHRRMQRQLAGIEALRPSYATLREHRGFADTDEPFKWQMK